MMTRKRTSIAMGAIVALALPISAQLQNDLPEAPPASAQMQEDLPEAPPASAQFRNDYVVSAEGI